MLLPPYPSIHEAEAEAIAHSSYGHSLSQVVIHLYLIHIPITYVPVIGHLLHGLMFLSFLYTSRQTQIDHNFVIVVCTRRGLYIVSINNFVVILIEDSFIHEGQFYVLYSDLHTNIKWCHFTITDHCALPSKYRKIVVHIHNFQRSIDCS